MTSCSRLPPRGRSQRRKRHHPRYNHGCLHMHALLFQRALLGMDHPSARSEGQASQRGRCSHLHRGIPCRNPWPDLERGSQRPRQAKARRQSPFRIRCDMSVSTVTSKPNTVIASCCFASATRSDDFSAFRVQAMTLSPRAVACRVISSPMPRLAPVISSVLPMDQLSFPIIAGSNGGRKKFRASLAQND